MVDLRTAEEVQLEGPGPMVGRVEISHRDLWPENGRLTDIMISRADGENPAVGFYLGYLRDRPDSIVGALNDIASADGAVVVHCAAGKDRTGVVVGLALAAVGVPMDAILDDYMATGERIIAVAERMRLSETYGRTWRTCRTRGGCRGRRPWSGCFRLWTAGRSGGCLRRALTRRCCAGVYGVNCDHIREPAWLWGSEGSAAPECPPREDQGGPGGVQLGSARLVRRKFASG